MAGTRHTQITAEHTANSVLARRRRRVRAVQIALGCIWILDAALQFQPRMFSDGLVNQMMLPMAQGQPHPIAWSITTLAHFIRPEVGVWNFFFGAIQLAIGVGMLFRRTVKPAIVAMAVWAFGVWWFGEGLGMLPTGSASPLTGAPGAVLLYPLIGLLVWPTSRDDQEVVPGIGSSAAAAGPLGTNAPLFAWSGFWTLSAILWLLPDNRAGGSIPAALTNSAGGEPSWYARFETSIAHALPQTGSTLPWLLALLSLVIAAAPLVSRRSRPFLILGVSLEAVYWVTGMAFGGMLTGLGTDPNVAPLIGLLAFAMWPLARTAPATSPARQLAGRHPVAGAATTAAALAVLVLSSTYPIAAGASAMASSRVHGVSGMGAMRGAGTGARQSPMTSSTKDMGSSMKGMGSSAASAMPGMAMSSAGPGARSAGMPRMGMGNTGMGSTSTTMPGMASTSTTMPGMAGTSSAGGMQPMPPSGSSTGSAGGGMSGMGGPGGSTTALSLPTTSPAGNITWPLPMGTMMAGMQMVTPNCTTEPTPSQQAAAVSLVDQTVSAVAPFESLAAAKAAGYVPITPTGAPVVHYANLAYLATPQTLDPNAIESLVYANTSHGAILVAAMYAMANDQVGQMPPMPGGCLTEWHVHTNLCFSTTSGVVVATEHNGACPAGSVNRVTQPMIHVWLAPITGGPLVVDAPDAQVVAAASQLPVPNPPNPAA